MLVLGVSGSLCCVACLAAVGSDWATAARPARPTRHVAVTTVRGLHPGGTL